MNKQELIEKLKTIDGGYGSRYYIAMGDVFELVEQLDEPDKLVVPQFVANYIEYTKVNEWDLLEAMDNVAYEDNKDLRKWFNDNIETFARAWLDGYEVEKEKRYMVKIKAVDQYLVSVKDEKFLGFLQSRLRSKFTRKELEDANFGWVFDCEGIEIEEVE